MLKHLKELAYTPSSPLEQLAGECAKIERLLFAPPAPMTAPGDKVDREAELEASLKQLVTLLGQKESLPSVDSSDVGAAKKKRRLTPQQESWGSYGNESPYGEDDIGAG